MNPNKVREMLRSKFNAHYGYEEESSTGDQGVSIDYAKVVSEMKGLESEIASGNETLGAMRTKLKQQILSEGEEARRAAKGDLQLREVNRKISAAMIRVGLKLQEDDNYKALSSELDQKDSRYRQLRVQKETFEWQNADVKEQLRRERAKKQFEQAETEA